MQLQNSKADGLEKRSYFNSQCLARVCAVLGFIGYFQRAPISLQGFITQDTSHFSTVSSKALSLLLIGTANILKFHKYIAYESLMKVSAPWLEGFPAPDLPGEALGAQEPRALHIQLFRWRVNQQSEAADSLPVPPPPRRWPKDHVCWKSETTLPVSGRQGENSLESRQFIK